MDFTTCAFDTERLTLRCCQMADAQALTALMTPEISSWLATWPTPLSLSETQEIVQAARTRALSGRSFPAVVVEKNAGAVIGWCKLDLADGQADLGYWIGERFQRRGFAMEVSKGAIRFAFDTMGCDTVRAGAQVGNTASLAVLEKLGMSPIGTQSYWTPARQRYEDCSFFVLTKKDWTTAPQG